MLDVIEVFGEPPHNTLRTIKGVRDELIVDIRKGVRCPFCTSFLKAYRRQINKGAATSLVMLYLISKRYPEKKYFNYKQISEKKYDKSGRNFINLGTDGFSTAKHWGLIEKQMNEDKTKSSSGMWGITQKGIDFVEKKISIEKYKIIFDDKILIDRDSMEDNPKIYIHQVNKFDFQLLMNELEDYY